MTKNTLATMRRRLAQMAASSKATDVKETPKPLPAPRLARARSSA